MAKIARTPPEAFREVASGDLALHGLRARAFQFPGGSRDVARAVVCLAGMGANGRSFARQAPLADDALFMPIDTPRETPPGANPLVFAAECVEELIAHERLVEPVVLGSSFGGTVAILVALRGRVAVRALVLVSAVASRWQIPLACPGFLDLLEAPEPLARLVAPLAAQIMGGPALDKAARDELVREARLVTGAELKRRLRALFELDLFDDLRRIEQPALCVHGSRDLLVPWRRGRKLAEALPRGRFALVKGAGHVPYLSHPARFNAELAAFLSTLW